MRKLLAICLIILLGIALGVAVAKLRIRAAQWNPTRDEGGQDARSSKAEVGQPAASLAQIPKLRILDHIAVES
jgi:hypothetical protein